MCECHITIIIRFIIYIGSQNAKVKEAGHDQCPSHGKGAHYIRNDAERLFRQLIVDGFLDEDIHITPQDYTLCYIKLGKRAPEILQGRIKVEEVSYAIKNIATFVLFINLFVIKDNANIFKYLPSKAIKDR